jgi:hypothetical protein
VLGSCCLLEYVRILAFDAQKPKKVVDEALKAVAAALMLAGD